MRPESDLGRAVAAAFSPDGALALAWPGFEPRAGQQRMAVGAADVIDTGGTLLAEAGTGTGKTLAYLIPAILSRQRVLVSTGTKNLQEQIFFKDLPALAEALGVRFTATLMKGRSNYLCLHRLHGVSDAAATPALFERGDREAAERAVFLPVIEEWAATTTTGDRAELRDLPEDLPLWGRISADAETCLGAECPRYNDCFVTLMRQRAAESDVVIVNHHLLCADAAVRHGSFGEVIPGAPTLVVDEAHQLEDVATNYFGVAISNYRVDELVRDGERVVATAHTSRRDQREDGAWSRPQIEDVARSLARVAEHSRRFFADVSTVRGAGDSPGETRIRYSS
ncbi:MAG TPA: ATP-dependent DNA helicase, partial [Vicinamibacterales bacterium]